MSNYTKPYTNFNEEANIWMHRCNHYGEKAWKMLGYNYEENEFSNENECYISIGCGSGSWDENDYNNIKNISDDKKKWNEFEIKYDGGKKPRYRYYLYRFFFEFKANDYIVVPSGGEFHVFQIENDDVLTYEDTDILTRFEAIDLSYEEIKNNKYDFKFFRKVRPVRVKIPRKGYATGNLYSKLKYQGTTLEIKAEASTELKKALSAGAPFSIYNTSMKWMARRLYRALTKISPEQFESLIAWYFKKKGADIYDVLPKNHANKVENEDADVLAIFDDIKLRIFVQAKAYTGNKIDLSHAETQIEKYMNLHVLNIKNEYTNLMWIVCLAKSNDVIENIDEIKAKGIRVINGMEFAEMLINVGLQDIDSALK